jgi:hypothetical protein
VKNAVATSLKMQKKPLMNALEHSLLFLLKEQNCPLNNAQVCRLMNGAKNKNDIAFCRPNKVVERGMSNLKRWGYQYENCKQHNLRPPKIAYHMKKLAKTGLIQTIFLRHRDPQKKGNNWDRMRFYGFDLSSILKEHIPFYGSEVKKCPQESWLGDIAVSCANNKPEIWECYPHKRPKTCPKLQFILSDLKKEAKP